MCAHHRTPLQYRYEYRTDNAWEIGPCARPTPRSAPHLTPPPPFGHPSRTTPHVVIMRTAVVFTALVAVFSAAVVANAAEQLDKAQFDSQVLADDAGAFFVKFYGESRAPAAWSR